MALLSEKKTREFIAAEIESNKERIVFNKKLYNLYASSIKSQLEVKIKADLGDKVYARVKERLSTINLWKKIVDKLSGIYSTPPIRRVTGGSDSENKSSQETLDKVVDVLNANHKFDKNNELYNCFGYSTLQIARDKRKPFIRSIPNYQFITVSFNLVDPTSVDATVLYMDTVKDEHGLEMDIFYVFTDDEFIVMDAKGDIQTQIMEGLEQDGTNPTKSLPFINWNDNEDSTMSEPRLDDLDMTLLVPLLLTDTNYGLKFQIFSIIYGINVKLQNLIISPDAFWDFSSDPDSDLKPEIGTIKPEFDSEKVLENIKTQVSLWLDSKGMKPGSIGSLDTGNAASGISKMVDMADVSESHDQQSSLYSRKEEEFWNKFFTDFYTFWIKGDMIDNLGVFSPNCRVVVEFPKKVPLVDRSQIIKDVLEELTGGLTSRKRAIMALNPEMDEETVMELIEEIDEEQPEEEISFGEKQNGNNPEDESSPSPVE